MGKGSKSTEKCAVALARKLAEPDALGGPRERVIAYRPQIAVAAAVHDQGLVPSAEDVPGQFVAVVEPVGVGTQQSRHA